MMHKTKAANGTGSIRWRNGKAYARMSLGAPAGRVTIALPACSTEEQAAARLALLAELASRLRAADALTLGLPLLERAGAAEGQRLDDVRRAVDLLCRGEYKAKPPSAAITFREFATRWTSGELAREYPDHVATKRTVSDDVYRLARHVYPLVGDVPLARFTLDHALAVMRSLPEDREPATRRRLGAAGAARARSYRWPHVARAVLGVYHDVTSRAAADPQAALA